MIKKIIIEKTKYEEPTTQKLLEALEKTDKKLAPLNVKPGLKNKNKKSVDRTDVSTMFTVFKYVPSRTYGFERVVTGHRYPNSKTQYPTEQYCYVEIKSDGLLSHRLDLGRKNGHGDIDWFRYARDSSREISPSQFQSAQTGCQFI